MNRLKLLREEKKMTQQELGKVLGVTPQAVGLYETEKRDMSTDILYKLANYFNCSIDYILGKSDVRNPDEIDTDKINIGLSKKDYAPLSKEQQDKIEEFAKFVLKDNLKKKEGK